MKVYGAVSSAEDSPLLKRNTGNKSETSSHFKRIAAATLLAGGAALAVASKNTNYSSSFAIIGGRNFHRVRGLGDALDDAKAGTLFYRFWRSKRGTFLPVIESFRRRALPFADRKNTAKRDSKREATRVFYRSTRASIEFLLFVYALFESAKGNSIFGVSLVL